MTLVSVDGETDDSNLQAQVLLKAVSAFTMTGSSAIVILVDDCINNIASGSFDKYWTKVYPFGSSALDSAIEGSDIDLVALSSMNVPSSLFFDELPRRLGELAEVSKVTVIASARVPLIKFRYRGVSVDIVFASVVALTPPSASDLLRDDFLLMVATECRSSINGVRTFLEIKQRMHIPYETYACTLKAVKRWAMQRKVYGNLFTYPNGVTLAIMVARLSQIFPSASPSTFFRSFFRFYSQWFRKEQPSAPIFITQDIHPRGARIAGMPMCWDARREHCKDELIPVINPAYPYVNASHAVGKCGYQFFLAELTRANRLLESSPSVLPLDELWEPYTMTKDFTLFVAVHVACVAPSEAECAEAFGPWKGLVESKVRMFIYALEYSVDVRPFSKAMPVKQLQDSARGLFFQETMFVMGVKERKEGIPVSKRLVARSFQELQCALRAAEQAHPGNEPFVRDHKRMKDPWVSYHSVYDSNFRAQLGDLLH